MLKKIIRQQKYIKSSSLWVTNIYVENRYKCKEIYLTNFVVQWMTTLRPNK